MLRHQLILVVQFINNKQRNFTSKSRIRTIFSHKFVSMLHIIIKTTISRIFQFLEKTRLLLIIILILLFFISLGYTDQRIDRNN